MPIYFSDIAPYCPVSRDQPVGPMVPPAIRTTVPHAFDLASALAAVNLLRSTINQLVTDRVINNVYSPPPLPPLPTSIIDRLRNARWREDKSMRVTRPYKYFAQDDNGNDIPSVWVMTERIEQMVWIDSAWRTSMTFSYGDKGEGEPVIPITPDSEFD